MTRVGIRCDAGPRLGVGHVARCVALAQELSTRGVAVEVLGDLGGVAWAEAQLRAGGWPVRSAPGSPEAHVVAARTLGLDAMVLDGYHLAPGTGTALRSAGVTVLALEDGGFGDQEADLVLDQNLGAEDGSLPSHGERLAGLRFALLRDDVRRLRPARPPQPRVVEAPSVLCVFGGTDAFEAGPTIVPLLLATGLPLRATVVAPRPHVAEALRALALGPGQQLAVVGPLDDLAARAVDVDLVVSAAGTSTWELCSLGAAAALVAVTENQQEGHDRATRRGLAAGLGGLTDLRRSETSRALAVEVLRGLLTDPGARGALSHTAWGAVDGQGRSRVVNTLLALVRPSGDRPAEPAVGEGVRQLAHVDAFAEEG